VADDELLGGTGRAAGPALETASNAGEAPVPAPRDERKRRAIPETAALFVVLVVLVIFFSITSQFFLNTNNLINILQNVARIGIVACPATLLLISDHGFGPIDWYVNFNVWLLDRGDIALQDSFYVKQKKWFYDRGVTPQWFYNVMVKLGLARQRVSRFRGKQTSWVERVGESAFLSRRHIDWSRTKAYSQGNFGQIFLNLLDRRVGKCRARDCTGEQQRKINGR